MAKYSVQRCIQKLWKAPSAQIQQDQAGCLFVVATPIGNLDDISPRLSNTLKNVQVIASEDTRTAAKLLRFLDIKTPLVSLHKENEKKKEQAEEKLLEYQKFAITAYGVSRMISELIDNSDCVIDMEIQVMVDTLRSYSSQFTEENIIRYHPE